MTIENTTTEITSATVVQNRPEVMSRKEFNSFLYDLYECKGWNNVSADAVYEGEDFYVEIFFNSPHGLMVAVHHGFRGFNYQSVDVMRPTIDATLLKAVV